MTTLKIGTRGSQLALWQARTVARLIADSGGPACELEIIRTAGDERPGPPDPPTPPQAVIAADTAPAAGSGAAPGSLPANVKATFVKEIEDALLDGRVDLAVHSSKDLAAAFPEGLALGATLPREDARDALLLPHGEQVTTLEQLLARTKTPCRIGTSSVRRSAQLGTLFPGATFVPLRGNVDTRLRKLDAGECDLTVLACAGLKRLGLAQRISLAVPVGACIPAPGQGIVAVQIRSDRDDVAAVVRRVSDAAAFDALTAERAIVRALGGGCQMPLGAYATTVEDRMSIMAIVIAPGGDEIVRDEIHGKRADAAQLGESLAAGLLDRGAAAILAKLR